MIELEPKWLRTVCHIRRPEVHGVESYTRGICLILSRRPEVHGVKSYTRGLCLLLSRRPEVHGVKSYTRGLCLLLSVSTDASICLNWHALET